MDVLPVLRRYGWIALARRSSQTFEEDLAVCTFTKLSGSTTSICR